MKKQYLSALVLALFTTTASAQFNTKEQAKAHIEALQFANLTAAATAKNAVNAASNEAGYNAAIKAFHQALNGSKVYFTNSGRANTKSYLTVSPTFNAAGDAAAPTVENVFELKYNAANDAFALKHAVTGRSLKNLPGLYTPVPTTADEDNLYTFVATGNNYTFSISNKATNDSKRYLHLDQHKTGEQFNVVRWEAGNGELTDASTWSIESANTPTNDQLKTAALLRITTYDLESNVGEKLGERQPTKEVEKIIDKGDNIESLPLADLQQLISAYADNKFFELNLPSDGLFFKIKSNDGTRYITATGASNGEWQLQTTKDANDEGTIFCLSDNHLVSLTTGRAVYLTNNKSQTKLAPYNVADLGKVEFSGLADGKYKMLVKQGTQTATVHLWQNTKTGVDGSGGDNTKAPETHLQLEEIEKVPVRFNAKGLASFCTPYAMEVPTGVEIYVASSFNATKDRINLTQLTDNVIPAGTAVVLKGTASQRVELNYYTYEDAVPAPTVNLFQGKATPSQIAAGQEARALKGDEFLVLNTQYVRGFRAYLSSAAGGATRSQLAFPGVTGVERVATAENAEAPIFDLSGRRVEKPVAGQIYVQNGQKFLQR